MVWNNDRFYHPTEDEVEHLNDDPMDRSDELFEESREIEGERNLFEVPDLVGSAIEEDESE